MMKKAFQIFSIAAVAAVLTLFVVGGVALAQAPLGNLGLEYQANIGLGTTPLLDIVANIINVAFGLLGTIAVGIILYGGFLYMTSTGEREKVDKARKLLINGAIGLGIIISAYAIAYFILNSLLKATIGGGGELTSGSAGGECIGGDCTNGRPGRPAKRLTCPDPDPKSPAPYICRIDPNKTTPGSYVNVTGELFGTTKGVSQVYFVSKDLIDEVTALPKDKVTVLPKAPFIKPDTTICGPERTVDCFVAEIAPGCDNLPAWAEDEVTVVVPTGITRSIDTYYIVLETLTAAFTTSVTDPDTQVVTDVVTPATIHYTYEKDARPKTSLGVPIGEFKSKFTLEAGDPKSGIAALCPNYGPIKSEVRVVGQYFRDQKVQTVDGKQVTSSLVFHKNNPTLAYAFNTIAAHKDALTGKLIPETIVKTYNDSTTTSWADKLIVTPVPENSYGYKKTVVPDVADVIGSGKNFTTTCFPDVDGIPSTAPCSTGFLCINNVCQAPAGAEGASCDSADGRIDDTDPGKCTTPEQGNCQDGLKCSTDTCLCEKSPSILGVDPLDGAPGTFVTISGLNFEEYFDTVTESAGEVWFLGGAGAGDDVKASFPLACGKAGDTWSDNQIIVQVPDTAADGPIKVVTASKKEDTTSDDVGLKIENDFNGFDVNAVVKPGLCNVKNATSGDDLNKPKGLSGDKITLNGANFSSAKILASWNFEEGKDQFAKDSEGVSNAEIISNNVPAVWSDGKFGKGITLHNIPGEANSEYLSVAPPTDPAKDVLNFTNPSGNLISISVWIKPTFPIVAREQIVDRGATSGWGLGITHDVSGYGKINFGNGDQFAETVDAVITPSAPSTDSPWYHIVVVGGDGDKPKFYVDDKLITAITSNSGISHPWPINTASGDSVTIGKASVGNQYYFNGSIDELKIFSGGLTPAEIDELYINSTPATEAYFSGALLANKPAWVVTEGQITDAVIPNIKTGTVRAQVKVGQQSSNSVQFDIKEPPKRPILNYVDIVTRPGGVDKFAPRGQYVSLYGSNFGSEPGKIVFNVANGISFTGGRTVDAIGVYPGIPETKSPRDPNPLFNFPLQCSDTDYWTDTSILFKVPELADWPDANLPLLSTAVPPNTNKVTLSVIDSNGYRNDESNDVKFIVCDPEKDTYCKKTPGICKIKPNQGPQKMSGVRIFGEGLGDFKLCGAGITNRTLSAKVFKATGIIVLTDDFGIPASGKISINGDEIFYSGHGDGSLTGVTGVDADHEITEPVQFINNCSSVLFFQTQLAEILAPLFPLIDGKNIWSDKILGPQSTASSVPSSLAVEGSPINVPDQASTGPVQVETANGTTNTLQFTVADCRKEPNICTPDVQSCCDVGPNSGVCVANPDMKTDCKAAVPPVSNLHYDFTTGLAGPRPGVPMVKQDPSCETSVPSPSPFMDSTNTCRSAAISATFVDTTGGNVGMVASNFNEGNIKVYKCATTLAGAGDTFDLAGCNISADGSGGTPVKHKDSITSIEGSYSYKNSAGVDVVKDVPDAGFTYVPASALDLNTWYYVVLKSGAAAMRSVDGFWLDGNRNGVPEVGDDYSWSFKVGNDNTACKVDKVQVLPNEAQLTAIGDTQGYSASVLAENCNILNANAFDWAWSTKLQNGDDDSSIALMSADLSDAIGAEDAVPASAAGVTPVVLAKPAVKAVPSLYKPNQTATAKKQGLVYVEAVPKLIDPTEGSHAGAALDKKDGDNRLIVDLNIPQISSVEPLDGRVHPQVDSYITIKGTNFGSSQGSSKIMIGDIPANVASCAGAWSDTRILAQIPKPKDIPADGVSTYKPELRQSALLTNANDVDSRGILLYDFNGENKSVVTDLLGNVDGVLNHITKEAGIEGNAIRVLTGSSEVEDSYVEIKATQAMKTAASGSIEFWFKLAYDPTTPVLDPPKLPATKQTLFAANDFTISAIPSSDPLYDGIVVSLASVDKFKTLPTQVKADTWYHLVYSSTDTRSYLYLNGEMVSAADVPVPVPVFIGDATDTVLSPFNFVYLGIKRNPAGNLINPMNGWLDNVAIYGVPLTHQMVAENYGIDPAANGLVALYDFEQGGVDFKNQTPNPLTITSTNFPAIEPLAYKGYFGKAPFFDGMSNYIQINDAPELVFDRGVSAAVWFKAPNADYLKGARRAIFSTGGIDMYVGTNGGSDCGAGDGNMLCFRMRLDDGATVAFKGVSADPMANGFKIGEWNLLVGTFDGNAMRLYINAKEVNKLENIVPTVEVDGKITSIAAGAVHVASYANKTICVGAQRASASVLIPGDGQLGCGDSTGAHDKYFLKGQIDTFALYNKAISAAQIADWYGTMDQSLISVITSGGTTAVLGAEEFKFKKSENIYPFICELQPDFGPQGTTIKVIGNNFGSDNHSKLGDEFFSNGSFFSYDLGEGTTILGDSQISNWNNTQITLKNPVGTITPEFATFKVRINPLSKSYIDANHNGDYDTGETYFNLAGTKLTTLDSTRYKYVTTPGDVNATYLESNDALFYTAPVITAISPDNGPHKQWVTITGYNFGTVEGNVYFTSSTGLVKAVLADCGSTAWSSNQIIVEVPDGVSPTTAPAITGPLYVERVIPLSTKKIPSNKVKFTVNTNPLGAGLCGISPVTPITPGSVVTLTGVRFGTLVSDSEVRINGATKLGIPVGPTPPPSPPAASSWSDTSTSIGTFPTITASGPVTLVKKIVTGKACAGFHIGAFCPGGSVDVFTEVPSNSVNLYITPASACNIGTSSVGSGKAFNISYLADKNIKAEVAVIATDGKYLYTKNWADYSDGTDKLHIYKIGTGTRGTVKGQLYATYETSDDQFMGNISFVYLPDGNFYGTNYVNGKFYKLTLNELDLNFTLTEETLPELPDDSKLLVRPHPTSSNLYYHLTTNGRYLFSVRFNATYTFVDTVVTSTTYDSWTVKILDPLSTPKWNVVKEFTINKSDVPPIVPVFSTNGIFADDKYLYLMEGWGQRRMAIIDWSLETPAYVSSYTTNQAFTNEISGVIDSYNHMAWLGELSGYEVVPSTPAALPHNFIYPYQCPSPSSCKVDADCGQCGVGTSSCVAGLCTPVIKDVSPKDKVDKVTPTGAVGDYVTITGCYLGNDGEVWFDGGAGTTDDDRQALPTNKEICGITWSDSEVVVEVPRLNELVNNPDDDAHTGPIRIKRLPDGAEVTTPSAGPVAITNFVINNDLVHPSVCSLTPNVGNPGSMVQINGKGFGSSQVETGDYVTFKGGPTDSEVQATNYVSCPTTSAIGSTADSSNIGDLKIVSKASGAAGNGYVLVLDATPAAVTKTPTIHFDFAPPAPLKDTAGDITAVATGCIPADCSAAPTFLTSIGSKTVMTLDGKSYLTIPANGSMTIGNKIESVSVWVKPTSDTATGGILHQENSWSRRIWYRGPTHQFEMRISSPTGTASATNPRYVYFKQPAESAPKNQWYHLVYTMDGSKMRFYVNGAEVKDGYIQEDATVAAQPIGGGIVIPANLVASSGIWQIGGGRSGASPVVESPFTGQIADFKFYNTTLSQPEIIALYQNFLPISVVATSASATASIKLTDPLSVTWQDVLDALNGNVNFSTAIIATTTKGTEKVEATDAQRLITGGGRNVTEVVAASGDSTNPDNLHLLAKTAGVVRNGYKVVISTVTGASSGIAVSPLVGTTYTVNVTLGSTDVTWKNLVDKLNDPLVDASTIILASTKIPYTSKILLGDAQTITLNGGAAADFKFWTENHICVNVPDRPVLAKTGPVEVSNQTETATGVSDNGVSYKVNAIQEGPTLKSSTPYPHQGADTEISKRVCSNGIISLLFNKPLDSATVKDNIALYSCDKKMAVSGESMIKKFFAGLNELITHGTLAQVFTEGVACESLADTDITLRQRDGGTQVILKPKYDMATQTVYKVAIGDGLAGKDGVLLDSAKDETGSIFRMSDKQVRIRIASVADAGTGVAAGDISVPTQTFGGHEILKRTCGEYLLVNSVTNYTSAPLKDKITFIRNYFGSSSCGDLTDNELIFKSNNFTFGVRGNSGNPDSGLCQIDNLDVTVYNNDKESGTVAQKDFFLCSGENCKLPFDTDQAPGPSNSNPDLAGNQHRYVANGKAREEVAASFTDKFERGQVNQGDNSFVSNPESCVLTAAITNGQLQLPAGKCEMQFVRVCPIDNKDGNDTVSTGDVLKKDCSGFAAGHVFVCYKNEDGADLCGKPLRDRKEYLIPERYPTGAPFVFNGEITNSNSGYGFLVGGNKIYRENVGGIKKYVLIENTGARADSKVVIGTPAGNFPAFSKFKIVYVDGVLSVFVDDILVIESSTATSTGIFGLYYNDGTLPGAWDNLDFSVQNFNLIKSTFTWSRTDTTDPGRLVTLTSRDKTVADRVQNETGEIFSQVMPVKTGETRIVIEGQAQAGELSNVISKDFPINIFICENPWPNFNESFENSAYNFMTRYCRDIGDAKDPAANLPAATIIDTDLLNKQSAEQSVVDLEQSATLSVAGSITLNEAVDAYKLALVNVNDIIDPASATRKAGLLAQVLAAGVKIATAGVAKAKTLSDALTSISTPAQIDDANIAYSTVKKFVDDLPSTLTEKAGFLTSLGLINTKNTATGNAAPMVVSTTPTGTNVPLGSDITATFSEDINSATITTSSFTVSGVSGVVTYSAATKTATFNPTGNLTNNTTYTATISTAVTDTATPVKHMDAAKTWSFNTGAVADITPPTATMTVSGSGDKGVSIDTKVTVVFSESMAPATVNSTSFLLKSGGMSGAVIPAAVSYSGVTAILTPNSNLLNGTEYTAMLTTVAKDLAGNSIATTSWKFTTITTTVVGAKCIGLEGAGNIGGTWSSTRKTALIGLSPNKLTAANTSTEPYQLVFGTNSISNASLAITDPEYSTVTTKTSFFIVNVDSGPGSLGAVSWATKVAPTNTYAANSDKHGISWLYYKGIEYNRSVDPLIAATFAAGDRILTAYNPTLKKVYWFKQTAGAGGFAFISENNISDIADVRLFPQVGLQGAGGYTIVASPSVLAQAIAAMASYTCP